MRQHRHSPTWYISALVKFKHQETKPSPGQQDKDHDQVRTSRGGIVSDFNNSKDFYHSYLESKVSSIGGTKEGFSQTDFPTDFEQEIVLGQYLENKLGPDFQELKVKYSPNNQTSDTQAINKVSNKYKLPTPAAPEIVIVEYDKAAEDEEEII